MIFITLFVCYQASDAIKNKNAFIILSDRLASKSRVPVRYKYCIYSSLY